VSAGTCEFLVDVRGRPYFLEMNTRLQVEHPVTELVTGRDLVADQLAIAGGAALAELGATQATIDDVRARGGHAIEVRLYAEDAEADFLPATGRVEALRWPDTEGIRVDPGIDEGSEVGARYDPLLGKIVSHGADRSEALTRLTAALDDTRVLGLVTNLRFLRWLVRQPAVADGLARVDTLERIWPPDDWAARAAIPDEAWRVAGAAFGAGGWRLNGPDVIRLASEDETRTVRLFSDPSSTTHAAIRRDDTAHVDVNGRSITFERASAPDVSAAARAAAAAHPGTGEAVVRAPMPGSVIAVHVASGSVVDSGDPIVTLEAMKMEHAVPAPGAGAVTEVLVALGEQVARGQTLATIEADSGR
jgi:acetyl-CoA/propionyl-CoA carboxylase biotin carboxyl carrier protein